MVQPPRNWSRGGFEPTWVTRVENKYGPWVYEKRVLWRMRASHRYTWDTAVEREIIDRRRNLKHYFSSLEWDRVRVQFESGEFPSWVDKKKMAEQRLRYL